MTEIQQDKELRELVENFLYDEIHSELENDSLYKNVWDYKENGTQTSVRWHDKARDALVGLIQARDKEIERTAVERVLGVWNVSDSDEVFYGLLSKEFPHMSVEELSS